VTRTELQREFRDLVHRLGKAALFVTHDLREALALGDRVGIMADGRLVEIATTDRFLSSDHPEARALAATLEATGADPEGRSAQRG
jgi:osmoprotectant transport system ATP-binding protein